MGPSRKVRGKKALPESGPGPLGTFGARVLLLSRHEGGNFGSRRLLFSKLKSRNALLTLSRVTWLLLSLLTAECAGDSLFLSLRESGHQQDWRVAGSTLLKPASHRERGSGPGAPAPRGSHVSLPPVFRIREAVVHHSSLLILLRGTSLSPLRLEPVLSRRHRWETPGLPGRCRAGAEQASSAPTCPLRRSTPLGLLIFSEGFPQGAGVSSVNGLWFAL